MLELSGIHVLFNADTPLSNHVIRGLDLSIGDGEFVTVIGSNGAGKSTLLGVLSGDVRPRSGRIRIDGNDVTLEGAPRRARLIGRVFQDPRAGTCEGLTILENLAVAAARGRARGLKAAGSWREAAHWRERLAKLGLGLENRLNDKVELLSGGQRQALSLLMACLAPNRILLLDEHTAALDPSAAATVLRLTDEFAARDRLTVLMVTHSMSQALAHGTRMLMLHGGRVLLDLTNEKKRALTPARLLDLFQKLRGEAVEGDALVLE